MNMTVVVQREEGLMQILYYIDRVSLILQFVNYCVMIFRINISSCDK
jgi:hypothetical protein